MGVRVKKFPYINTGEGYREGGLGKVSESLHILFKILKNF